MPPKNRRRRRLQVSTSFKGDDGSHSDSGRETERKLKKVRWEHNSNTMDGEGDCSDSDESSAGLEQAVMSFVFSYLRVDESVQICLTTWCKQYVILQQLLPVRHPWLLQWPHWLCLLWFCYMYDLCHGRHGGITAFRPDCDALAVFISLRNCLLTASAQFWNNLTPT